jgi:hypothetical protein
MAKKQVPTAMSHHATTEELFEMVFSVVRASMNPDTTIEELCSLCECKGIIKCEVVPTLN